MSPCWTGKYGGHPSHRRVFLFNHWFTDEILDVLFELMPLSSSPPTPDRNETPEVTNDVRTSGASDCRSFLCVKMRSSRCHNDLIKSNPPLPDTTLSSTAQTVVMHRMVSTHLEYKKGSQPLLLDILKRGFIKSRVPSSNKSDARGLRLRTVEESRVNSVPAGFTWAK
jgi:hypothetical protein